MIVEVCGLGSDRKKEDKGFISANQTTSFTSSGRGLRPRGRDPNLENSQCLCVNVICLGGIIDIKARKYCLLIPHSKPVHTFHICVYIYGQSLCDWFHSA